MPKTAIIAHGQSALVALARQAGLKQSHEIYTCNMTEEEIAERDRPVSRQERRKLEREARKGHNSGEANE